MGIHSFSLVLYTFEILHSSLTNFNRLFKEQFQIRSKIEFKVGRSHLLLAYLPQNTQSCSIIFNLIFKSDVYHRCFVYLSNTEYSPFAWHFARSQGYSWRRKWQPTPIFLPEESQGQRSLAGLQSIGLRRVGHD